MGWRLTVAGLYLPEFIRKRKLQLLMDITADAFQSAPPSLQGLSYAAALHCYAIFSGEQAEKTLKNGHQAEVGARLYENAYKLGRQLQKEFGVKTQSDLTRACRLIYQMINIDYREDAPGRVVIRHCFFSDYYSGAVCSLISALDAGLLGGLSGGGKLEFLQRITEGQICCKAVLTAPGRGN